MFWHFSAHPPHNLLGCFCTKELGHEGVRIDPPHYVQISPSRTPSLSPLYAKNVNSYRNVKNETFLEIFGRKTCKSRKNFVPLQSIWDALRVKAAAQHSSSKLSSAFALHFTCHLVNRWEDWPSLGFEEVMGRCAENMHHQTPPNKERQKISQ